MSRSYVVFGEVLSSPFTTYIFIKFLEQHIELLIPRQQPIKLPLLSALPYVRFRNVWG